MMYSRVGWTVLVGTILLYTVIGLSGWGENHAYHGGGSDETCGAGRLKFDC